VRVARRVRGCLAAFKAVAGCQWRTRPVPDACGTGNASRQPGGHKLIYEAATEGPFRVSVFGQHSGCLRPAGLCSISVVVVHNGDW
jgi:hypothetical protein